MYYKLIMGRTSVAFEARTDKEAAAKARRKIKAEESDPESGYCPGYDAKPTLYYYRDYEPWSGEMFFASEPTYEQRHIIAID